MTATAKPTFRCFAPEFAYTWYILRSSDGGFSRRNGERNPHFSAQGDYDGDGKTDVAVWDPITAQFYVLEDVRAVVQRFFTDKTAIIRLLTLIHTNETLDFGFAILDWIRINKYFLIQSKI